MVVAQSGRFLTERAHAAGYRVRVADCYGDIDTLAIAEKWQIISRLDDIKTLTRQLIELSQGQSCLLIYGSGIELFYPALRHLPDNITLLGNNTSTLESLHSKHFFTVLQQLKIDHPATKYTLPDISNNWLEKSFHGFGGSHIYPVSSTPTQHDRYYQHYIEGQSGSALFISHSDQVTILSIHASFCSHHVQSPFLLQGLSAPLILSQPQEQILLRTIQLLTQQWSLVGINSLDFIIDEYGQLLVLEINPRISASAQLLPVDWPLFESHHQACVGGQLPTTTPNQPEHTTHLYTVFAPTDIVIPDDIHWPDYCHDLPAYNDFIQQDHPICTVIIETDLSFDLSYTQIKNSIYALLSCA